MNEADPSPINLDELKMMPAWLREDSPAPSKQYAGHDYPSVNDRLDRRGGRQTGFGDRNDRRDHRSGGVVDRRSEGGRTGSPPRRSGARDDRRASLPTPPEPVMPAPVRVEFLPDDRCLASINKQIRTTHLAYPLFGLARMFLQEPERHHVQLSVAAEAPAGTLLYRLGEEGPVTLDRATLEKMAFDKTKDQFYAEETLQKEPLKGNFTNVARERLSGVLLGPTNYHAYQPALRALYEARYSRRMSFEDFRRNVEVSTDPTLIERWKEEARTTKTVSTRVAEGEIPVVLNSPADVRTHFRQNHLDSQVHSGVTFKVHGSIAKQLPEPAMMQAIRESHEREMRYPAQFVQLLRQGLQNAGLHIFKHRKRVVYVSLSRPTPFIAHGSVSPNVAEILQTITQSPLCTRKLLAERVLSKTLNPRSTPADFSPGIAAVPALNTEELATKAEPDSEINLKVESAVQISPESSGQIDDEVQSNDGGKVAPTDVLDPVKNLASDALAKARSVLAADLRFLVQSGHIIEFHNGTFDLPLTPKDKDESTSSGTVSNKQKEANRPAVQRNILPNSSTNRSTIPGVSDVEENVKAVEDDDSITEDASGNSAGSIVYSGDRLQGTDNELPVSGVDIQTNIKTSEQRVGELPTAKLIAQPALMTHDKVDGDGRISGRTSAPMDMPIPGDI